MFLQLIHNCTTFLYTFITGLKQNSETLLKRVLYSLIMHFPNIVRLKHESIKIKAPENEFFFFIFILHYQNWVPTLPTMQPGNLQLDLALLFLQCSWEDAAVTSRVTEDVYTGSS